MNDGLDNFTYDELYMIRDVFAAKLLNSKTHVYREEYRSIVEKAKVQIEELNDHRRASDA